MRHTRYVAFALVVYLILNVACSKTLHKYEYFSKEDVPKMVYIENDVRHLNTQVNIHKEKQIYVEIIKNDGVKETGRLIRITQEYFVLSQGFYYSTVNDSTSKVENKIVIPKEEILILKVW